MSRKVAVMTGTRADFGLLRPLLLELDSRADTELRLIVTGTHMSGTHGRTISEIDVNISAMVEIWGDNDSPTAAAVAD
jgi:UDP-N-acetylglucosamine 2-epimerase